MRLAYVAIVRIKLQSKDKPLATGGTAQSQGASMNDTLKHPDGSENRPSLCLPKKIRDKDMHGENFQ